MAEAGRPSKYSQDKVDLAVELAKNGNTITAICKLLKINRTTYYNWAEEHPELKKVIDTELRRAELKEIQAVKKSLVKRAKGYKTKELKQHFDENGVLLGFDLTTKEVPGDVKAQQFYLINKAPEEFKAQPTDTGNNESQDNTIHIIFDNEE